MCRKLILLLLAIVGLFFEFGLTTNTAANDLSLSSFSSGAILSEKSTEYNSAWGNI